MKEETGSGVRGKCELPETEKNDKQEGVEVRRG